MAMLGQGIHNMLAVDPKTLQQGPVGGPIPINIAPENPGFKFPKGTGNALIGLGEGMYGNKLANDNVNNNRRDWRQQVRDAQGGNVTGGDTETYFDPETNTYKTKRSGRREGMLTGLYDQTANYEAADPYELAQKMYDLKTPGRELFQTNQQNQLDERLNARGMGFSSSGNDQFRSLAQGQNLANNEEMSGNFRLGQDMANSEQARYMNAINAIYGNDSAESQQMQNANAMGVTVAPTGMQDAYKNQMNTKGATGGTLGDILGIAGNAIAPGIGGMLGKVAGSFFS